MFRAPDRTASCRRHGFERDLRRELLELEPRRELLRLGSADEEPGLPGSGDRARGRGRDARSGPAMDGRLQQLAWDRGNQRLRGRAAHRAKY